MRGFLSFHISSFSLHFEELGMIKVNDKIAWGLGGGFLSIHLSSFSLHFEEIRIKESLPYALALYCVNSDLRGFKT